MFQPAGFDSIITQFVILFCFVFFLKKNSSASDCHTPRRNADVASALDAFVRVHAFAGAVFDYIRHELWPIQVQFEKGFF